MHCSQLRYGLSILALTLALLIMQLLDPLIFGQKSPFLVVLAIAVILSAWYGGMRTGLFATVLIAFAYDYFLVSPNYSLLGINPKENLQLSLFLLAGVLMSWLTRLVRGLKLPTQLNTLKFQQHQHNTDHDIKLLHKCYQLLCEQTGNIVLFLRRDGRIIAANQAAVKAYGYPQEELLSLKLQDLTVPNDSVDLEKMAQADNQSALVKTIHRHKDGKTFPVEVSVQSPVCTDIDQQKQTEETERFLSEANQELASSLDYQTTLTNVARLSVPRIADWCAIDMLDEDQAIHRLAVVHADPSKVTWAQELQKRYPHHPDDSYGVPNALRTGRPELYPEVSGDLLIAIARDAEHLSVLRQVGFTSAMVVPLIVRRRILGAITLVSAGSGRHYDASDLNFAEELARRASLAIDSASLLKAVQQELICRIQTEAALRESEERFRIMADSAPVLLWVAGTDITEQKSTEQALRDRARELATLSAVLAETNASLEKRNRELDQFAYAASHDLKAPLRAIAHLSSWIEEDTQDQLNEETRHQMNLLRGRVNRMEALQG